MTPKTHITWGGGLEIVVYFSCLQCDIRYTYTLLSTIFYTPLLLNSKIGVIGVINPYKIRDF